MTGRTPPLAAIFLPLACGYLLSYIFRTINGPLADELIRRFSLDAGSLGLLTSMYFLAFAVSAIPIGVALDALGPRRVQGWLMSVAAVGAIVFALAPTASVLIIGRLLIGLGVAGGLMAGLKAHALWVSPRYLPLANGGLVMFGGLGAIAATLPVGAINAEFGWRGTFVILAAFSTATAIAIFALVPRHSTAMQCQNWRDAPRGFIDAVTDRRFWRFAPLSASVVGTAFAIQGLWAARWLVDIEGYGSDQLLHELLAMGVGLTLGALVIGVATTWLRNRGVGEATVFSGFCITFIVLQVVLLLRSPARSSDVGTDWRVWWNAGAQLLDSRHYVSLGTRRACKQRPQCTAPNDRLVSTGWDGNCDCALARRRDRSLPSRRISCRVRCAAGVAIGRAGLVFFTPAIRSREADSEADFA